MPRRHALDRTHYRTAKVCALTGLGRNQLRYMVEAGLFPPPVVVGVRAGRTTPKLYLIREVEQWLAMRQ